MINIASCPEVVYLRGIGLGSSLEDETSGLGYSRFLYCLLFVCVCVCVLSISASVLPCLAHITVNLGVFSGFWLNHSVHSPRFCFFFF